MNAEPYYNEPGYETRFDPTASANYNAIIKHETIRCAVCDVMERNVSYPDDLFEIMKITFLEQFGDYVQTCKDGVSKDKTPMRDPFHGCKGSFDYTRLLSRLEALKSGFEI